jgi:hypothetical protein
MVQNAAKEEPGGWGGVTASFALVVKIIAQNDCDWLVATERYFLLATKNTKNAPRPRM